jgi:hypothetical protein
MATKKSASARVGRKAAAKPTVEKKRLVAAVAAGASNSNQLLREAAWSRMFGRAELKNPFTR